MYCAYRLNVYSARELQLEDGNLGLPQHSPKSAFTVNLIYTFSIWSFHPENTQLPLSGNTCIGKMLLYKQLPLMLYVINMQVHKWACLFGPRTSPVFVGFFFVVSLVKSSWWHSPAFWCGLAWFVYEGCTEQLASLKVIWTNSNRHFPAHKSAAVLPQQAPKPFPAAASFLFTSLFIP